jgi:hypothetical protein
MPVTNLRNPIFGRSEDHRKHRDMGRNSQYWASIFHPVRLKPQTRTLTARVPYRLDLFGEKADFRVAAAEFVVARIVRPNNRNI